MKKVQNCLFITRQGVSLHKEGKAITVTEKDDLGAKHTLLKLPLRAIRNINCFGTIFVSPYLMAHCGELGISISFFTANGKFQATVCGPQKGSILVRIEQYRHFFNARQSITLVKNTLAAKILSERQLLLRHLRTYGETPQLIDASKRLKFTVAELKKAETIDMLRGFEGDAAKVYFSVFPCLIRNADFSFKERNRRPPRDPVNALLSFFYMILQQDITSALQAAGLDSQLGYLHRPRSGRHSLALDLLEEFRTPVVDRFVLALINRAQVTPDDFEQDDIQGCSLKDASRRKVLEVWQSRKLQEIIHPYLQEKIYAGHLPNVQASLLAAYFRGDISSYPPYVLR